MKAKERENLHLILVMEEIEVKQKLIKIKFKAMW